MPPLRFPPSYLGSCLFISCALLALGIFVPFFLGLFIFAIVVTLFNSVLMFIEDKKFEKRGLLRYLHGRLPAQG